MKLDPKQDFALLSDDELLAQTDNILELLPV
jgi:hypothetical protein